jgi:hypothetical protein
VGISLEIEELASPLSELDGGRHGSVIAVVRMREEKSTLSLRRVR